MIRMIDHFRQLSATRDYVKNDQALLNPRDCNLTLDEQTNLRQMSLENCLSIEPHREGRGINDAWFCEETLANMIRLKIPDAAPDVYFGDPTQLQMWLSMRFGEKFVVDRLQNAVA